jgi:hypothetical protein
VYAFTVEECTDVHFIGYGKGATNEDTKLSNANYYDRTSKTYYEWSWYCSHHRSLYGWHIDMVEIDVCN